MDPDPRDTATRAPAALWQAAKEVSARLLPWPYGQRYRALFELARRPGTAALLRETGLLRDREVRRFADIDKCCGRGKGEVALLRRSPTALQYCAPSFVNQPEDLLAPRPRPGVLAGPDRYAAVFGGATVIGGSSLVLLPGLLALYDLRSFDTERRFRYTDEGLHGYLGPHCVVKRQGEGEPLPRAIHLGGNFSWNYYHFMIEVLARFRAIDDLRLDPAIPLLVDRVNLEVPQYRQLLDALNRDGRALVAMDPGKRYAVGELYFCSYPNVVVPNYLRIQDMRPEDTLFDLDSLDALREVLRQHAERAGPPPSHWPRRMFLSRKNASHRRKFNEDEILSALAPLGVQAVYPEDLTVAEQVALFQQAELVIGGSGAAFTNLLFCRPGCKAIILAKERLQLGLFSGIAAHVGVDLHYVTADDSTGSAGGDLHEAFAIDPLGLKAVVAEWIRQGEPGPMAA